MLPKVEDMKVTITKSDRDEKKLKAVFYDNDKKIKTTHFGLKGSSTFIDHKDEKKKKAYLARHSRNDEDWGDHMSAGSLSRYILWNKETLSASIADYKKRFKVD